MSDKNTKKVSKPIHGNNSVTAETQISLPDDMDIELIDAFISESRNMLTIAENALRDLETDPGNMEAVDAVFRTFHNIKGTSAFFEIPVMTKMAHHAESFLNLIRNGKIRYAGKYADLAMGTLDMFEQLFNALEDAMDSQTFLKPGDYDDILHFLSNPEKSDIQIVTSGFKKDSEKSEQTVTSGFKKDSKKPEVTKKTGDVIQLPSAKPRPAEKKKTDESVPFQPPKPTDTERKQTDAASLMDIARGLRGDHTRNTGDPQTAETSIQVPVDRLDRFIDMVGELVVSHSMVAQHNLITESHHHDLLKKVSHTSKIVRELQNMSMSMRMIPLRAIFRKMAALVNELSRKLGKNIAFVVQGEDTEVDRNMVNAINDPLIHIIRNAVDHGIERPEIRVKAGKPPHGTIRLSAYHSAGNVIMKVEDDGQGFDREAILRKAEKRGLISSNAEGVDMIHDHEVFNLVFQAGFSTTEIISEVSGRGMGMDVVKKNIESLRGQVEVKSVPERGSVFKMILPLTLAIIDGMVVRVGKERYVIPTISIVRSVCPEAKDISTVIGRGKMLSLQEKLIPLVRLGELFGIEESQYDPTRAIVVVIEDDERHVGILVDELIGTQQIVIKTLGETMRSIPGISGSAIMPNGRVGLILDVSKLVGLALS